MEKRFVMVSGTGDFDGVIQGTAAECLKRYFEAMGYEFRIQEDEGEYWLYVLNTAGGGLGGGAHIALQAGLQNAHFGHAGAIDQMLEVSGKNLLA